VEPSGYIIFIDDGGVMNDNLKRAPQWQRWVGELFARRYGGTPELWGEANRNIYMSVFEETIASLEKCPDKEYETFIAEYSRRWIEGMFSTAGFTPPPRSEYEEIFNSTTRYVTPKVRAAFPGVIDSIRALHGKGFTMYTASGENSIELDGYITGMGVRDLFSGLYGMDLENNWKWDDRFYRAIFRDVGISTEHAIVVNNDLKMLGNARELGAHVIQVCQTGEHQPYFPYYLTLMGDLPQMVEMVIRENRSPRKEI